MSGGIDMILRILVSRIEAEHLELEAWNAFRKAAMSDPSVTLEACDQAWAALKAKAAKMHAARSNG